MAGKVRKTSTGRHTRWEDGNLTLVRAANDFGLPTRFFIVIREAGSERILSRHRKRRAAEQKFARLLRQRHAAN